MEKKIHFTSEGLGFKVDGLGNSHRKNPSSERKNPSSLNSHPSSFDWKPSVQIDLFNYLKPSQQKAIRPYLRILKRDYQEKLCVSLLDYLEGHGLEPLNEPILRAMQDEIIVSCNLHPLSCRSCKPERLGDIISRLFPSFAGLKGSKGLNGLKRTPQTPQTSQTL